MDNIHMCIGIYVYSRVEGAELGLGLAGVELGLGLAGVLVVVVGLGLAGVAGALE